MIELGVLLPQHVALSLQEAVPEWDRLFVPLASCSDTEFKYSAGPGLADYGERLLRGLWYALPTQVVVELSASVSAGVVVSSVSGANSLMNKLTKYPGWRSLTQGVQAYPVVRSAKFAWKASSFVLTSDMSMTSYSFSRSSQRMTAVPVEQLTSAPLSRATGPVPGPQLTLNERAPSFESYDRSYDHPTTNTPAGTPGPALQTFPRARR